MAEKQNSASSRGGEPVEVFRQFAWHLAGSLAAARAGSKAGGSPSAAKPRATRGAGKR